MPRTRQVAQKRDRSFNDIKEDDAELRTLRDQISNLDKQRAKNDKLVESATLHLCKISEEATKARKEYAARLYHLEYEVDVDATQGDVYDVVLYENQTNVKNVSNMTYRDAAKCYDDLKSQSDLTDVQKDYRDCTGLELQGSVVLRLADNLDSEEDDDTLLVLALVRHVGPTQVHADQDSNQDSNQVQSEQSVKQGADQVPHQSVEQGADQDVQVVKLEVGQDVRVVHIQVPDHVQVVRMCPSKCTSPKEGQEEATSARKRKIDEL